MDDFAARFFGPILLRFVGIPEEDVDSVQQLERKTFSNPERDPGGKIQTNAAHTRADYLVALVKKARAELPAQDERTDDPLTFMLTRPMGDGRLMTDEEVKAALPSCVRACGAPSTTSMRALRPGRRLGGVLEEVDTSSPTSPDVLSTARRRIHSRRNKSRHCPSSVKRSLEIGTTATRSSPSRSAATG
jgi:hypothetical protein